MTDPADQHLEERLHAFARGLVVPPASVHDDLRRGRRRLLRLRVAMAGATTGTLAVVLGLTALTAGDPTATEPPVVSRPTSVPPSTPEASPSASPSSAAPQAPPRTTRTGGGPGAAVPASGGPGPSTTSPAGDPTNGRPGATAGGVPRPGSGTAPAEQRPPTSPPAGETADPLPTDPATPSPSTLPTEEATDPPDVPPTQESPVRVGKVLRYYNDVLAERLDPPRHHLQSYDRATGQPTVTRSGGTFFALGASYPWADADGTGAFSVLVASGWDQVAWECGATSTDWACHAPEDASATPAEVAEHDDVRQVAVEHADGQVVVLTTADATLAEADLVAAAADERLTLPVGAAVSPPRLDPAAFAAAGRSLLVRGEEELVESARDRSPRVRGSWVVDGRTRGSLEWSALPLYSGAGWSCLATYRTCTEVELDEAGTTVHVARVRARAGGGWVVEYDGPSYAVQVASADPALPKKRAYGLVTMADWQPSR